MLYMYFRLFLARGADVEAKNRENETPIQVWHYFMGIKNLINLIPVGIFCICDEKID